MNYQANFEKWIADPRLCEEGRIELESLQDEAEDIEYRLAANSNSGRQACAG